MEVALSEPQRRAVEYSEGPLLVLAGPGAGKTRVLTERVRSLLDVQNPNFRVLALTFTNKAANEMKERLEAVAKIRHRAFIGTLHAFCMEVLANRGKPLGIHGLPNIFESLEDRKQLLLEAAESHPELRFALRAGGDHRRRDRALSDCLQAISDFKSNLILPEMLGQDFERQLYEVYQAALKASEAVDFDDLLLLAYRLFEGYPKVAGFYRRQYRYICVDEAQDLNEAQYRVLCALCGQEHRNIMLVGDPGQAIYMWNGADPKYLDLFLRDFGAETIRLTDNFRCSRSVVRAAQVLDPTYEIEGQLPIAGELVLRRFNGESEEAAYVVTTIEELLDEGHQDVEGPITLDRCAVLGRNRYVFGTLERLIKEKEWPYYKKASMAAHEFSSDLVQEFETALRVVANPHDRLHLGMLIAKWNVPSSAEDIRARLRAGNISGLQAVSIIASSARAGEARSISEAIGVMNWQTESFDLSPALRRLREDLRSFSAEEQETVSRDLDEWQQAWRQFRISRPGGRQDLSTFLSHVALGTTEQAKKDGLALLTVHSAKGLEFDVIFLIGMAEGTFPDYRARSPSSLAEEQRNAFVAVTRSRRLLYVSWAKRKLMPWGDSRATQPSRYFVDLEAL